MRRHFRTRGTSNTRTRRRCSGPCRRTGKKDGEQLCDTGEILEDDAKGIRQMRLEARDISFKYGKGTRQILDHVTLTVEPGEKCGDHGAQRIREDDALQDPGRVREAGFRGRFSCGRDAGPRASRLQPGADGVAASGALGESEETAENGDWRKATGPLRIPRREGPDRGGTWDPGRVERPVPGGGLRRRASALLYCEGAGATDGTPDRGRDDDDAGPHYPRDRSGTLS